MTKVKMEATDTVHITAVQAEPIQPGEQFEVDVDAATDLEKRGLASKVPAAKTRPANKE